MKYKSKKLDYNTCDLEKLSSSELKKLADHWLRQHLLSKQDSTYYFCPIKERHYSADNMHVAHFIDRQCLKLRYSLDNCHLISAQSNMWDAQVLMEGFKSKHHYEYEVYLRKKLGEEKFEELLQESKELVIFTKEDYIKIINKFKNE